MDTLELEFARIVREHKGTIYTVCYMFSKDEEEVSDLFQDILVNLWKGFAAFRGNSSARTWIYRVSLNTCISADSEEDIRQIRMLQSRISRLGPFDRAIVLLWLENLSYDEIGAIVGITAKNVSVRLFRIREQLRNMSDEK